MKVYIVGRISGNPDDYDHFQRAALKVRMMDHTVISPMILPGGLDNEDYAHIFYSMMDVSEGVYFLDNWKDSEIAQEAFRYANHTGKVILYEREEA